MKLFVLLAVLALAVVGEAALCKVVKPVLKDVSCLTNGLSSGLTQSAGQIGSGVDTAGKALNSVTSGVGSIAQGTVSGLGNTVQAIPKALYELLCHLNHMHGLVGSLLNSLL